MSPELKDALIDCLRAFESLARSLERIATEEHEPKPQKKKKPAE